MKSPKCHIYLVFFFGAFREYHQYFQNGDTEEEHGCDQTSRAGDMGPSGREIEGCVVRQRGSVV